MPDPSLSPADKPSRKQPLWVMLLALLSGFALSQAYRTTTAIVAQGLQGDFGLQASSLGAFAGLFGLSFDVAQLLMGIGLVRYGLRRTVLAAAPLGIAGAALSALDHHLVQAIGHPRIAIQAIAARAACLLVVAPDGAPSLLMPQAAA